MAESTRSQTSKRVAKKKSSWSKQARRITSFYLLFSSILLALSGVLLFISPSGRWASSINWRVLGFDKEQWENIHVVLSIFWVAFAVYHLILNWKPFIGYLRDRVKKSYRFTWEMGAALALTILLVLAAAFNWGPVNALMDWSETVKDYWVLRAYPEADVGHEEETTVVEVTPEATPETTAGEGEGYGVGGPGAVAGWGRYTVQEIVDMYGDQYGVTLDQALTNLQAAGFEADASSTVRDLVDQDLSKSPSEVVEIMLGLPAGTLEQD